MEDDLLNDSSRVEGAGMPKNWKRIQPEMDGGRTHAPVWAFEIETLINQKMM